MQGIGQPSPYPFSRGYALLLSTAILLVGGFLLLKLSGGIPPTSWLLLVQILPTLSSLFDARGSSIAVPLVLLVLQAGLLLCSWLSLFFAAYKITASWPLLFPQPAHFVQPLDAPLQPMPALTATLVAEPETEEVAKAPPPAFAEFDLDDFFAEPPTTLVPVLTLVTAARTISGQGKKYLLNEDRLFAQNWQITDILKSSPYGLFLVVDGDGNAMRGQEVSKLVVQGITDAVMPYHRTMEHLSELPGRFIEGIRDANLSLYYLNTGQTPLSASLASVLVTDDIAHIFQIGSCRVYLYRQQHHRIQRITSSLPDTSDEEEDAPSFSSALHFPEVMGSTASLFVQAVPLALQPGDCLLLCSDGIWSMLSDADLEHVLEHDSEEPAWQVDKLVTEALERGGDDNASVILIHYLQQPFRSHEDDI